MARSIARSKPPSQRHWKLVDSRKSFPSTALRHIARRYLGEQCDTLATVAAKAAGYPLWAMKNARSQIEHVFVRDPDSGLSIDVRGAMLLNKWPKDLRLNTPSIILLRSMAKRLEQPSALQPRPICAKRTKRSRMICPECWKRSDRLPRTTPSRSRRKSQVSSDLFPLRADQQLAWPHPDRDTTANR